MSCSHCQELFPDNDRCSIHYPLHIPFVLIYQLIFFRLFHKKFINSIKSQVGEKNTEWLKYRGGKCYLLFLQLQVCLTFTEEPGAEEEEPEEEEGEQQLKGTDLKLASRRDMYTICQGAGLGELQAAR